jgi:hypothetical protein
MIIQDHSMEYGYEWNMVMNFMIKLKNLMGYGIHGLIFH